jgi:hypothetical protein
MAIGCRQLKEDINKLRFTSKNSFMPDLGVTKEQFNLEMYDLIINFHNFLI